LLGENQEVAIICGMAKATLPDCGIDWDSYFADYNRIRDKIGPTPRAECAPENRVRNGLAGGESRILCQIRKYI
jgi:hypothetical protein